MIKLKDIINECGCTGTNQRINELEDNEGQMAKAQLERSMEYSKMIYDFMEKFGGDSDKLQFPAWVQSKLTKSMDYLQSVYNYLDGKDGLADDPAALARKQGVENLPEDIELTEKYYIRSQKCTQSDGDKGNTVMYYTDKKGKKRSSCHTSKKRAKGQIAAIEAPPR